VVWGKQLQLDVWPRPWRQAAGAYCSLIDPQGNASTGRTDQADRENSSYDLLIFDTLRECVVETTGAGTRYHTGDR
jgi:hypothetical protein